MGTLYVRSLGMSTSQSFSLSSSPASWSSSQWTKFASIRASLKCSVPSIEGSSTHRSPLWSRSGNLWQCSILPVSIRSRGTAPSPFYPRLHCHHNQLPFSQCIRTFSETVETGDIQNIDCYWNCGVWNDNIFKVLNAIETAECGMTIHSKYWMLLKLWTVEWQYIQNIECYWNCGLPLGLMCETSNCTSKLWGS